MKILVVFSILMLLSTSLAKSQDRRKSKTKVKQEPVEEGRRSLHQERHGPSRSFGERFPGIREKPLIPYVDEETRGRQPRQSHITIQVPALSNQGGNQGSGPLQQGIPLQFNGGFPFGNLPGNQGNGGIQQDIPLQFQGSFQSENRPGYQGSLQIPGGVISELTFPTGRPPESSSASGPGGLNSASDSGLVGGLGGVYGGGYGFGLGGLIFGGPAGPVFAGNAALSEGPGGNTNVANDESNNDSPPQNPLFRPVPPRGSFFNDNRQVTKPTVNNQGNRGVGSGHLPNYPDNSKTAAKSSGASNAGETIGYVAFIFPRRSAGKPNIQSAEHSRSVSTQTSSNEAAASRTRATTNNLPTPVVNRPGPFYVPVPVHISIDRPYPVPVPKAYPVQVLKPYPVAIPKPVPVPVPVPLGLPIAEPMPYEIAKHIPVPVDFPKPVNFEVPIYVNYEHSSGVRLLQPSYETRVLRKRFDKVARFS